jgi:hypothetical protein
LSSNPHVTKKEKKRKKGEGAGRQWLTPIFLATQEAKIRRKPVQANSSQDPISKKTHNNKRSGEVAQVVEYLPSKCEAESKPQCHSK